jgi:hypothetical protein
MAYAASTLLCTPASLAQEVGTALGAQAGEARLRDAVTAAGFTRFRRAAATPFNLVLEALLESLTQASTLAVAGSTLLVFALFQPLRRRVQATVDRRFDRKRYEGDRIARAFAERLRDEVDPDRLRLELDSVLAQTLAPTRTGLWLRGEHEGRS